MGFVRYIKNQFRHDRNMKRMLSEQNEELRQIRTLLMEQRIHAFREKTLMSKEMGISGERLCDNEVVVSLTSFGKRIYDVHLAIESIMQGTVKPNRIVLWLSEEEFKGKPLPRMLEMQKARGLQVEFCEDIRSYKKLIPSLKQFPEDCIITIDDDAIYEYDLVERLVTAHLENPNAVCACRMHKVKLAEDGKPLSYMDWDWCVECYETNSNLLFPTTGGGTLFPSGCLCQEVFNKRVFMELCPYADDVWFYAMRLMSDTPVVQVYTGKPVGYFTELPSMNLEALSKENTDVENCRNDAQIKAVMDKYDLYRFLI